MTALATKRAVPSAHWNDKQFTLPATIACFEGGKAILITSGANAGKVVPASTAVNGRFIGHFAESKLAGAADSLVNINLLDEITVRYYAGAGFTTADVGKLVYSLDDQTVTLAGGVLCGMIMQVDSVKGVGVDCSVGKVAAAGGGKVAPALAFVANDAAPVDVINGGIYNLPATGAASTVTLPAAAADGTVAQFVADGTNNGHTVQYRDATGTVLLTTALVASKRHLVTVAKVNGKWAANAYVSP